jgi:hypothetical protein
MNLKLLAETKRKIELLRSGKKGKIIYPQFVKDAVIELSVDMTASQIAKELGLSKTFSCETIRYNRKSSNKKNNNSLIHSKNTSFIDITNEFKSFVKDDLIIEKNEKQSPLMKFTTQSGTIIEIFS